MRYWLMKSEPEDCSIDDLAKAPKQRVPWTGVRNFQARNFMRYEMQIGDQVLFYHSSCEVPGIYGLAEVCSEPYPDETQFDKKSKYYDEKSKREKPRWYLVDVKLVEKTRAVPLSEMRATPEIADMIVLRRGNRLSITPVDLKDWNFITKKLVKA